MKILIVSDAWKPQTNGVVRVIESLSRELTRMGHIVRVIGPGDAGQFTLPLPFYRDIRLAFFARRNLSHVLNDFAPDIIHIATEGPLGWTMRGLCLRRALAFTTAYHTRFPAYIAARSPRFLSGNVIALAHKILRSFHAPSRRILVATSSLECELVACGFRAERLARWTPGVDRDLFQPYGKSVAAYENLPRPILLYVGRVAVEKNLPAFLNLHGSGSLVVIGDGPDLAALGQRYPRAHFLGAKSGEDLARHYAAADLFVFPSLTDTFGLVLLEACAAGLRVAALSTPGTRDIFADPLSRNFSALDLNLQNAVIHALSLPADPALPRAFAARFSWAASAERFLALAASGSGGI